MHYISKITGKNNHDTHFFWIKDHLAFFYTQNIKAKFTYTVK